MALVGNLKDLKLPSLIQLNCMERNTAKLTIEYGSKYGFIYFEGGQVVHAEFGQDIGEAAVTRLMGLYSGKFKVEGIARPPANTIKKHWNNLLLDSLHQLDDSEDSPERKYNHLFERLLTVRGVKTISILNRDGTVVTSSSPEGILENHLFAFIQMQAEKAGETIGNERPEFVSIAAAGKKYVFTGYNLLNVVLEMEHKTKLDMVLPLIKQALQ